ncbi:hypothetical protein H7X69_03160 [Candidatus Saccharibacteria bacterium]|nr:hypothetical protein [Candidatus Saccharibacteria bacterium]
MKDLDFDELDRAVNSLLPNNSTPADGQAVDNIIPSTGDVPAQPVSQPLAARRSSGRFMDVVHPSSDMRTTTVPARPVSREGAAIIPSVSRTPVEKPLAPRQSTSWSPTEIPPVVTEGSKKATDNWPDPIDFPSSLPDEAPTTVIEPGMDELAQSNHEQPTDDDKDINQIVDAINQTLGQGQDSSAPLESPFLMDAKVEKRPLGAFSTEAITPPADSLQETTIPSLAEPEVVVQEGENEVEQADQPIEMSTPLPAELQDDLLLIEAGLDTEGQSKKDEPVVTQQPQTEVPLGPMSITQQYAEQPSTGDQPTGAIFDTGAYQKPLAHPAKKKPGWLLVLWIVLLLVAGAGAGAAVYFFVLPKL